VSVTFDYYFNSDKSLDQLQSEINSWLGCDLAPYATDPEDLFARFLGMEFSLGTHSLDNDRDLDFESFRYEIGIRIPVPDWEVRDLAISAMVLVILILYRRLNISAGIFVFDVQKLLGRYEERKTPEGNFGLFDLVTQNFVTIPGHLNDLYNYGH